MNKIKTIMFVGVVFVLSAILVGCGCQRTATYTVTFDSNGGTKVKTQEVKENKKVEEPEDPTKEGYTFKGWYLNSKKYDFDKKVTKDIKLKAKWIKKASEDDTLNDDTANTITTNYYLPVTNTESNNSESSKPSEEVVKKDAEVSIDLPSTSNIGEAVEFTLTTIANDYAETPVYGVVYISDLDAVDKIEYLSVDGNWYELGDEADEEFLLEDTSNTFRVTFNKAGTYDFQFALVDAETGDILAETKATTTVEMKEAEVNFELPEKFVVGESAEFTVSTKANDYAGLMVVGTGKIADETVIEKLEYLEVNDGNWYELPKGSDFGVATGFPLADATSTFKATFNTAGTYEITFQILNAEDRTVVAEETTTITVEEKQVIEPTVNFELPEKFVVGEAAEFTVSTKANDYAGLMVVGTGKIADETVIEKLEYLEVNDGNWYELPKGSDFGVATGFPLADATSTFKATFNTAGTYEITFQILNAEDRTVVAEITTPITVEENTTVAV